MAHIFRTLFGFIAAVFIATPISAATVSSDFGFGSGTPFEGTTTLSGVTVTLSSTVTQPFGISSFRDTVSDEDATVLFEFSEFISTFSLDVSRVRNDEFLTDFSVGNPDTLTGGLSFTPSGVGTILGGDFNSGTLSWTGLNTKSIGFTISTAFGAALALDEFSFDAAPMSVVPLPASIFPMALALLGVGLLGRRRAR